MKRTVVFLLMVVALMLAACGPAAGAEPEACKAELGCAKIAKGQTIKIGFAGPMTGDYSQFGIDMSQGMKIAVPDAGDVQGFKFELVIEDDGGSAEGGAAVANKLVTDPTFVAMAGHAFSGATSAAMPIYEKAGIPMLSPSATNPDLTKKGSKVFNRTPFTDSDQAKYAAAYLFTTLGKKNMAILHDGTDYGQGLAKGVEAAYTELGGTVVAFEAVTPGESDYSAVLAAVASKAPEAVYYGGYNAEAAVIANQMEAAGLKGVTLFGTDGVYGADFITKAAANAEGVYATTMLPTTGDAVTKFDEAYKAAFGTEPGVLSPYTWTSYDAFTVLASAVKSVAVLSGDTLYIPRGALMAAVRGTKDHNGLAGVITCREDGECNASGPTFMIVKDGKWEVVK